MPRRRFDPARDARLWNAVFDRSRPGTLFRETEKDVRNVRALFVEQLHWTREMCERYRFRAMALAARPQGEIVQAVLRGPAHYARHAPPALLESLLEEASFLPATDADRLIQEALMPHTPEVDEIQRPYRLFLSDTDYQFITDLARERGLDIRPSDPHKGNVDLAHAVLALLKDAYE